MSIEHLKLLRRALENSKWRVVEELPGNDYDVSSYWKVSRPSGMPEFYLAFEGLDDLETLPIEKSYGCYVVENKGINLYFGSLKRSYPQQLRRFIEAIENGNT